MNGAAYVYTESAGSWATVPAATFTGSLDQSLGSSVALSAHGLVALVGGPGALLGGGTTNVYRSLPAAGTPARWPPSGAAPARASALRWRSRPTAGWPWSALTTPAAAPGRRSLMPRQADVPAGDRRSTTWPVIFVPRYRREPAHRRSPHRTNHLADGGIVSHTGCRSRRRAVTGDSGEVLVSGALAASEIAGSASVKTKGTGKVEKRSDDGSNGDCG